MAVERFPIEASHILMFARAIGDENPVYADSEAAKASEVGGIVAPPTFAIASAQFDPDYPLRPKAGRTWFGSGKHASGLAKPATDDPGAAGASGEPAASESGASDAGAGGKPAHKPKSGAAAGGLHAEQHFTYHRPLRPGDVLTATTQPGRTWEKEGKRAGKLVFNEWVTEYRDARGELVVTARSVGVRTERVIEAG
jgi:acyl dehydratase